MVGPGRAGSGRAGPGRFITDIGLGGENKHFFFYDTYSKNASFSRYAYINFPLYTNMKLSCERSEAKLRFASLRSQ